MKVDPRCGPAVIEENCRNCLREIGRRIDFERESKGLRPLSFVFYKAGKKDRSYIPIFVLFSPKLGNKSNHTFFSFWKSKHVLFMHI